MQTILTLTVFPPPSLLKQQKPRRRQRHAQHNQKKLTRQAYEDDQYPGNDQEDTRDPPSPAATPAHAHPLLLYPYAQGSFSFHRSQQAEPVFSSAAVCQTLMPLRTRAILRIFPRVTRGLSPPSLPPQFAKHRCFCLCGRFRSSSSNVKNPDTANHRIGILLCFAF